MKRLFILLSLFFCGIVYAVPSNQISGLTSFSPNTVISSSAVNGNNNTIQSAYNSHTHTDLTQLGIVTIGNWNASPVATQFGGTGQNFSSSASGATLYFSNTGIISSLPAPLVGSIYLYTTASATETWLNPGSNGYILTSNGAGADPSYQQGGRLIQEIYTKTSTGYTDTNHIPFNNTIPQIASGTSISALDTSITPLNASDKIEVDVSAIICCSTTDIGTLALFQDNNANAIMSVPVDSASSAGPKVITFSYYENVSQVASATTLKLRFGYSTTSYCNLNASGSPVYGGTMYSSMTVKEIRNP